MQTVTGHGRRVGRLLDSTKCTYRGLGRHDAQQKVSVFVRLEGTIVAQRL